MKRTPEPEELMADPEQAAAYAAADFSDANDRFLALFEALLDGPFCGAALDLGCGPGDIPAALLRAHPHSRVDVLDGAAAMLALAEPRLTAAAAPARWRLLCHHLPCAELPAAHYDAVLSNSLLHHLADPHDLWRTLQRCARPGAPVLVMDLCRPDSPAAVDALLARYAADAPPVLSRDFAASLHAAYRPDEVQAQLAACGIHGLAVRAVSDRHLAVSGVMAPA